MNQYFPTPYIRYLILQFIPPLTISVNDGMIDEKEIPLDY